MENKDLIKSIVKNAIDIVNCPDGLLLNTKYENIPKDFIDFFSEDENKVIINFEIKEELRSIGIYLSDYFIDCILQELYRRAFFKYKTNNGLILSSHTMYKEYESRKEFSILHATKNINKIIESKSLFSSLGCLPFCIYGVPHSEGEDVHNLMNYIVCKELDFTKSKENGLIYLHFYDFNEDVNILYSGFDSRMLGRTYFEIYQSILFSNDFSFLFSQLLELNKEIDSQMIKVESFLNTVNHDEKSIVSLDSYFELCEHISIFYGIYFESIIEYIMMFQSDEYSQISLEKGHINNVNYKNLIFDLSNSFKNNFNISKFNIKATDLFDYMKRSGFIKYNENHFVSFLCSRIYHNIFYRLLGREKYEINNKYLRGNLLYHIIKRNKLYEKLFDIFNQKRKLSITELRNTHNVSFPYNSIIPKGEIGINTSNQSYSFDAYVASIGENGVLRLHDKLDIALDSRLVNDDLKAMTAKI